MKVIKMGPKDISEILDYFYNKTLTRFSLSSLLNTLKGKERKSILLSMGIRRLPSLYVLIDKNGPYLIGLTTQQALEDERFYSEEVPALKEMFSTYAAIFSRYYGRNLQIGEAKSSLAYVDENTVFDSFGIVGDEDYLKRKMMSENITGKKKVTVAGFFSEDSFKILVDSYETWNDNGFRFDFSKNETFFSIRCSKEGFYNDDPIEIKAIGEFYSSILSSWLPGFLKPASRKFEIPGVTKALSTFSIDFEKMPIWILKLEEFRKFYEESVYSISEFMNTELKIKLDSIGGIGI